MPSVETYYLIDFENVHEDGLSGSENLNSHDHVHLFSTKNAPKISFETLTHLNSADLSSHEIPVGNQSLDMHLVSYLGYLIGINANRQYRYVIISNDKDYDNIIAFWKTQNSSDITRRNRIAGTTKKGASKTTDTAKSANTAQPNNKSTVTPINKSQLNTEIQRTVSNAGYTKNTINKVASIVVKHYGEDQFANNVHNELRNTYTNYSDIYKIIKPIINKYSSTMTKKTNATTQLNCAIQKLLSNAGFTSDIINSVASVVSKHYNDKNGKQTIYRAIVAKYGQGRGLNIYNHIKNSL